MDKITMLFIRACKSKDPMRRLFRIYKSNYISHLDDFPSGHMCDILSEIVVEHDLISLKKFIFDYCDPKQAWKYGSCESDQYYDRMVKALISIIKLSRTSDIQGLIVPIKFRRVR